MFAFGVDALLAVLVSGAFACGHGQARVGLASCGAFRWWKFGGGGVPVREDEPGTGFGEIFMPGGCSPDDFAGGQLFVGPAVGAAAEGFGEVVFAAEHLAVGGVGGAPPDIFSGRSCRRQRNNVRGLRLICHFRKLRV